MAVRETLIIKLGALGDVVRTTPLLRRLSGRVTWVAAREALPLLERHPAIHRAAPIEEASGLAGRRFDLVVNFDEDPRACRLAQRVQAARTVGARLRLGERAYCDASAPWFDMGLISRLGRRRADALKAAGRRSYQDYLFAACGLRFSGEEYWLSPRARLGGGARVALEPSVGAKWPAKAWSGFGALERLLREEGRECVALRRRRSLADYVEDVGACGVVVAGDTLAMHLGLALRKKVVALFNCTSPHEIHGYGRLVKIVHERLEDFFYRRRPLPASEALPLETVAEAVRAVSAADCSAASLARPWRARNAA